MKELSANSLLIGTITKVQDGKKSTKPIAVSDIADIVGGLTSKLFGKSINDATREYEGVLSMYKEENKSIVEDLVKLYEIRKKTVELIQKVYDFFNQNNNNAINSNSVRIALSYTDVFRKIMELDLKGELPRFGEETMGIEHYSASILTGLRTQNANLSIAASLGSALAITTTISSILVSGATAASLIAGPIGLIGGGIVLASVGFLQRKKNAEVVKKLENATKEIQVKYDMVKSEHDNLKLISIRTREMNDNLHDSLSRLDGNCSEKETERITDTCKLLGKILNETIEMQYSHE